MGRKEVMDQKRSLGEREREEVGKVALFQHNFVAAVEVERDMNLVGEGRNEALRWMKLAVGDGAEDRVEEDLDKVQYKVLEVVVGERGRMVLLCMGFGVGTQVRGEIRRREGKAQEAYCGGLVVEEEYNFETLGANSDAVLHANFLVEGDRAYVAMDLQHSDCLSLENQSVVWALGR